MQALRREALATRDFVARSWGLRPFNQPGWMYEIKYDGYRLLASVYAGDVRSGTKAGGGCIGLVPRGRPRASHTPRRPTHLRWLSVRARRAGPS